MVCGNQVAKASIREMFAFARGPAGYKGVVAVFVGYFDGSNTHAGTKVWSYCGFLGELSAFESMDDAWNRVLGDPQWPSKITRFHAVDCVHGEGEFKDGWSFPQRLALVGDLVSVLTSCDLLALGSVVINEDFNKLDASERDLMRSEGLGEPLDLCFQYILQRSIALTRQTSEDETVGLIFDNEIPAVTERCLAFSNLYRTKFGFGKWLIGIGFGSSTQFTPLQAADLLAHSTYRYSMQRYPEYREPELPTTPAFLRMLQGIQAAGGGFDLDSMKQLAAEIKNRQSRSQGVQP